MESAESTPQQHTRDCRVFFFSGYANVFNFTVLLSVCLCFVFYR